MSSKSKGIEFRVGDATRPEGDGHRVIAHVCNDIGGWGAGFVLAISRRWTEPERAYRDAHQAGKTIELGCVQFVEVEPDITVANMIAQHGVRRGRRSPPPIRYDALQIALEQVASFAVSRQATVHMPRIGCGLAGGRWEEVEAIVRRTLVDRGVLVTVYDLASGPDA